MATHVIEIDDEVLGYLRSKVRDFHETPNAVLRRELHLGEGAAVTRRAAQVERAAPPSTGQRPPIPLGIPEALSQILEVVVLVRRGGFDRVTATLQVAKRRGVTRETIGDKYGRQLGLSTDEFDRLLVEPDLQGLRVRLLERFPRNRADVVAFLDPLRGPSPAA